MIEVVKPVIDYRVRELCQRPYYGHPKGCPNYGRKKGCPPSAAYYDVIYDLNQPVYAVINKFDLHSHVKTMKERHPEWTDRQLRNCLYWQPKARKTLKNFIGDFMSLRHPFDSYGVEECPEAMGVDLIKTMRQLRIQLIFPVRDTAYQIALIGTRKDGRTTPLHLF